MVLTSKTGLLSSVKKTVTRRVVELQIPEFKNITSPAPFVLRPFAGLYNPFPYGCSILCNHPADCEAKEVVKRARDTWASEGKNSNETLQRSKTGDDGDEMVPEELFRRYTDTDSRPLTPTPTLASVMTRIPGGRRCVTPDPVPIPTQERMLLVLDLRRSQSQETLSCYTSGLPTTVLQPPTRSPTPNSGATSKRNFKARKISSDMSKSDSDNENKKTTNLTLPPTIRDEIEEEDVPRRRGRQRRKSKKSARHSSAGLEKEVKGLAEPWDTQVSAFSNDSRIGSARPSVSVMGSDGAPITVEGQPVDQGPIANSFLDSDILKQLRRELDQEVIDSEFDYKRKTALEETMRIFPPDKKPSQNEEMLQLKRELRLPPENTELWISLPRTFSRQSARFELPLDKRVLNTMTPIEYIQKHVAITSGRRLLYNRIFNRHRKKVEDDEEEDSTQERKISGQKLILALGEVMGRPFTDSEAQEFKDLLGWENNDWMDFRTWCGICALCERVLGPRFCAQLPSRDIDPCNGIEKADFDTLPRRLATLSPDPRLVTILKAIREL